MPRKIAAGDARSPITLTFRHWNHLGLEVWQGQLFAKYGQLISRLRNGHPCPMSADALYEATGIPQAFIAAHNAAMSPEAYANLQWLRTPGNVTVMVDAIEVEVRNVPFTVPQTFPLTVASTVQQELTPWLKKALELEDQIEQAMQHVLPILKGTKQDVEWALPGLLAQCGIKAPKRRPTSARMVEISHQCDVGFVQSTLAHASMLPDGVPAVWLKNVNPNTVRLF